MKKIFIRTDGSSNLGLGHVIRCLSLATMLREEFATCFYIKDAGILIIKTIEDEGFEIKVIENEIAFLNEVKENQIVVLDGYHFDTDYQLRLKNLGAILICIDDLHDRHFVADVIINQAPGITNVKYQCESYTRFFLGPRYALLRPSFQRQAVHKREIGKIDQVLVCFGGSDVKNLTLAILNTLLTYPSLGNIIVITGSAYPYLSELQKIISINSHIAHHHNIGEQEIVEVLLDVQLAIVPASGILFEVIACKTPAISGYYVDNQLDIYHGFRELGVFYDAGNFEPSKLKAALDLALASDPVTVMINQSTCIDGKSADRYIDMFNNL